MPTPATDAILIIFAALDEPEQQEVAERIATVRAINAVSEETASAPFIRSLRRVADFIGHEPTVDEYKDACYALREQGEDIKGFSAVVRHYGTWRCAKEAMDLSKLTSIRNVDARFRHRRVGKIWRFSEETLRETLERVVEYYGSIPLSPSTMPGVSGSCVWLPLRGTTRCRCRALDRSGSATAAGRRRSCTSAIPPRR